MLPLPFPLQLHNAQVVCRSFQGLTIIFSKAASQNFTQESRCTSSCSRGCKKKKLLCFTLSGAGDSLWKGERQQSFRKVYLSMFWHRNQQDKCRSWKCLPHLGALELILPPKLLQLKGKNNQKLEMKSLLHFPF